VKTLFGHILTSNGSNLLTAVDGGGLGTNNAAALNTNRTAAQAWETFTLVLQPGSKPIGPGMTFALQTSSGDYLTAINGGGVGGPNDIMCPIHTDQTIASAGAWELFTLIVNDSANPPTVQIRPFTTNPTTGANPTTAYFVTASNGGNVGGSDPSNTQPVHSNAAAVGQWEQFSFSAVIPSGAPVNINCNTNINGPWQGNIAGSISLTIESDGSCSFSGKENNSNWLPYNMAVAVAVVGFDNTVYTFTAQGGIGAGLPFSNNNWNWMSNGINGNVQTNWNTSIGLGWTWYYNVSATLDAGSLLNSLMQDIQTVVQVVKAVYAVVEFLAA
jgi:hypothetical protein